MDPKFAAELAGALLSEGVDIKDLPKEKQAQVVAMSQFITTSVGYLATFFPNTRINSLMTQVWALVGTKQINPAVGPPVQTVSFAALGGRGVILLPHHWLSQIADDLVMQTGAMVCVGSQTVDFWNGRHIEFDAAYFRSRAYEAEYLLTNTKLAPGLKLNDYQQRVMAEFPQGLDTDGVASRLLYDHKPVPDHSPYTIRA
jgi:hypothetical protein